MAEGILAVTMPKWGLAMSEGTVVAWHAAEGAAVKKGDDLLDVETTKITNVVEAPGDGTLRRVVVPEGTTAPVGALVGVVAETSVAEGDIDAFVATFTARFEAEAAAVGDTAAAEPESIDVADYRLSYLRTGTGEGPPLVLVHGFGGDLNNWLFNQPMLSQHAPVYALDLPGHGRSSKQVGDGDITSLASVLRQALAALGIDRAHLAGHSLGGAVVLQAALDEPERAASLTLVAPVGFGPDINMDYINGFIEAGRRKQMKAVLQSLFADPGLVSREMVDDLLKYKRLDGAERALKTLSNAAFPGGRQVTLLKPRLADIAAPVQVIWGAQDRIIPAAHAERLPDRVESVILESAGHMVHMEQAGEVNARIERFLAP